jgi:hypothetical protein
MKKLVVASLLALGLSAGAVYAETSAAEILEHANKTASSAEGVAGDMSAMKAAGKCGADQSSKKAVPKKQRASTKAELELEHANKLATGDDGVEGKMGNMKAQGKCGSN